MEVEDRLAVARDLRRIGLTMEHRELASGPLRGLGLKPSGRKREQIGRNRRRLAEADRRRRAARLARLLGGVGDRAPALRNVQRQRESCLQVRLVEAWEGEPRPGRHEQRVHELGIAVERQVAAGERQAHLVGAGAEHRRGNDEVLVAHLRLECAGQRARVADAVGRSGKIEDHRAGDVRKREGNHRRSGDRGVRRRRDREVQPVLDVLQPLRPFLGERRRHTGSDRVLGVGMAGGKHHGDENRDGSEMSAGHASRLSANRSWRGFRLQPEGCGVAGAISLRLTPAAGLPPAAGRHAVLLTSSRRAAT